MRSLRIFAAATVLATSACTQIAEAPDPAVPAAAAPAAAIDHEKEPAWLSSEAAVFEHVQRAYEKAGFAGLGGAILKTSEAVPLPFYHAATHTLTVPPFADGIERMRERLARMSASHFSGALTFIDAFASDAEAYEAYRAFLTVAVAHELAHHLQAQRPGGGRAPGDFYDIEAEAIDFEQAFLAQQIAAKEVPGRWAAHYRRAVMAIRDSLPARAMDSLPSDDKALREGFGAAYCTYGQAEGEAAAEGGVNVEISAAVVVFAGYTRKRLTGLARGGPSLSELAAAEGKRRGGAAASGE